MCRSHCLHPNRCTRLKTRPLTREGYCLDTHRRCGPDSSCYDSTFNCPEKHPRVMSRVPVLATNSHLTSVALRRLILPAHSTTLPVLLAFFPSRTHLHRLHGLFVPHPRLTPVPQALSKHTRTHPAFPQVFQPLITRLSVPATYTFPQASPSFSTRIPSLLAYLVVALADLPR